jgi:hypothetical protein
MAGVPGKNKIERGFRILWDDSGGSARDLTAALLPGTLQGGGLTLDEIDMSGASDSVKKYLGGAGSGVVTGQFHMDDTATTGAFTVCKATLGSIGTLTLQYGSNGAAPSTGDPEWEGEHVLISMSIAPNGGKMVMTCTWQPASGQADPAWGTVA